MTKRIHVSDLEKLSNDAVDSRRRRANLNVHQSLDAQVQRLFIATEPGTYIRPHRHTEPHKWEFFLLLQGEMDLVTFDDSGMLMERIALSAADVRAVEISPGTWHSYVCKAPATVALEVKQGAYIPTAPDDFASWAPPEGADEVGDFLNWMRTAAINSGPAAAAQR